MLPASSGDTVLCASSEGHALGVGVDLIPVLSGAGKGSILMKIDEGDRLLGAVVASESGGVLLVKTEKGKTHELSRDKILGARADRGGQIVKRDRFARIVPPAVVAPVLEGGKSSAPPKAGQADDAASRAHSSEDGGERGPRKPPREMN